MQYLTINDLRTPIDDNPLEDAIATFRKARGILALQEMQEISLACGNNRMSDGEIEAEISEARVQRQV